LTIHCILKAQEKDFGGYITYVFETLECNVPFGHRYCMVTRLPNWEHCDLEIGDKGFLSYRDVVAGEDSWYCPETGERIPYNYTNSYFIKFIKEKDNSKKDIII
jgi:hypothetical protein